MIPLASCFQTDAGMRTFLSTLFVLTAKLGQERDLAAHLLYQFRRRLDRFAPPVLALKLLVDRRMSLFSDADKASLSQG
jgi:hypothetical protein